MRMPARGWGGYEFARRRETILRLLFYTLRCIFTFVAPLLSIRLQERCHGEHVHQVVVCESECQFYLHRSTSIAFANSVRVQHIIRWGILADIGRL